MIYSAFQFALRFTAVAASYARAFKKRIVYAGIFFYRINRLKNDDFNFW